MDVLERIKMGEVTVIAFQNVVDGSEMPDNLLKKHMEQDTLDVAELLRLAKLGAEAEKEIKLIRSGLEGIRDCKYQNPHLVADRLLRLCSGL